ncbi:MAG: hypothetical protein B7Z54_02395, partial [Sphingobacteriales bacterium 12-47-4]
MRRLLTIPFLLFLVAGFGQARSFTAQTYSGSQQTYVYKPPGYNSRKDWPLHIYLSGQGGVANNNISLLLNEGLPKKLNTGADYPLVALMAQLSTSFGTWEDAAITLIWNYATTNLQFDLNEVYIHGLSLGGAGTTLQLKVNPDRYAAAMVVSGSWNDLASGAIAGYFQVPVYQIHGTSDATVGYSSFDVVCDSIWARVNNGQSCQVLPKNQYIWGVGHSSVVWDDSVYTQFGKWMSWLHLHHKNKDTTAKRYVDSLHLAPTWDFYWQAKRAVDAIASSSFKTGLLNDLATEYAIINGVGSRRFLIDLGVSGKTTSGNITNVTAGTNGTTASNIVDDQGVASSYGFTVVARVNSGTPTVDKGIPGPYFGFAANTLDDAHEPYQSGGTYRLTNLNNSKTYNLRLPCITDQFSATQLGTRIEIGGVEKAVTLGYRSFTKYIEFLNVSPSSGNIDIAIKAQTLSGGWGAINAIELVEAGTTPEATTPPTANAGLDQTLIWPQNYCTLYGGWPSFSQKSNNGGKIVSWVWSKISGPGTAEIDKYKDYTDNATSVDSAVFIKGLSLGTHQFELLITDSSGGTDRDTVQVVVQNCTYNNSPKSITITADVYKPFSFATDFNVLPGDTVKIDAAQVDSLDNFIVGNVHGCPGQPIIIKPINGRLNIGTIKFSNTGEGVGNNKSSYIHLDGSGVPGYTYGVKARQFVIGTAHHMEANNIWSDNSGQVGIVIAPYENATPKSLDRMFPAHYMRGIYLHDFKVTRSVNEGVYVGGSTPQTFVGYSDPINARGDSVYIYNGEIDTSGQDGIQVSSFYKAWIFHNYMDRPAKNNIAGHGTGIILGSGTGGKIWNNIIRRAANQGILVSGHDSV